MFLRQNSRIRSVCGRRWVDCEDNWRTSEKALEDEGRGRRGVEGPRGVRAK